MKNYPFYLILCLFPALLNSQTPTLIVQQEGHRGDALLVRFSPDERQALSAEASRLILWDLNSGKFVRAIPTEARPRLISFSASGQEALAMLENGRLIAWDLNSGQQLWRQVLPFDSIFSVIILPDGRTEKAETPGLNIQSVFVSPDRKYLVAAFNNQYVACWDLQDGRMLWRHKLKNQASGMLGYLKEGKELAWYNPDGSAEQAWITNSGKKITLPEKGERLEESELAKIHSYFELLAFQRSIQKCTQTLEQNGKTLNLPIVDFAFSEQNKVLAVGLGKRTRLWSTTPGTSPNRSGRGGLLLWNVEKDRLIWLQDFMPEIVNQVDISQDGKWVLTASSDQTIRLWDVATGKEKCRMERNRPMETNIQFSADFRQMVMTRADGTLKYWELNQRNDLEVKNEFVDNFALSADGHQLLRADRSGNLFLDSFPLQNLSKNSLEDRHFCLEVATALSFSADGKKVLTGSSLEGRAVKFSLNLIPLSIVLDFVQNEKGDTIGFVSTQTKTLRNAGGLLRTTIDTLTLFGKCSPDRPNSGNFVYQPDLFNVALWDLDKRQSIKVFKTDAASGWYPISAVGFSPDGNTAYATVKDKKNAWDLSSGKRLRNKNGIDYFHAVEWNMLPPRAASILEDQNNLSIWSLADGQQRSILHTPSKLLALAFHPNGRTICALSEDGHLTEWDTEKKEIERQIPGLAPENKLDMAPEALISLSEWNRMEYAPDPDYVLVRSTKAAVLFHIPSGKCMLKFSLPNQERLSENGIFYDGHQGIQVSSMKFLPDGRRILVTFYDGTIQCWNYKTGNLVFNVYFLGNKDWVVTMPSGLFDASPGAMNWMYYVVGREIIELDQIKERYYQPGLLPMLMGFVDGEIREAREFKNLPLYPEFHFSIEGNQLSVHLSPRQGGLGKLSLFVNGKQVSNDINLERRTDLQHDLTHYAKFYRSDTANIIALRAYNAEGWLKSQVYETTFTPDFSKGEGKQESPPPACSEVKPSLYLVVVGTSRYTDDSKSLNFPDIDASEMAKALSSTGQRLFGDQVYLKLLSTAGDSVELSSKSNIEAAFKEIAQKANPCDVLVAYFSGHGANWGKDSDKSNFYYLTKDITTAKLSDPEIRSAFAISDEDLTRWLANIPAQKQVLILDACNSGKAAETMSGSGERDFNPDQVIAFELLKDKTGTFILTGSTADMSSFESNQYGQGLLTYSLLQGMSGTALKEGKYVDIMTLFQSARNLVPKLAQTIKQVQTPVIAAPKGASSFPIGIKDESVKIEVTPLKPVVIWSSFQDRDQFNDPIGLTQALNDYFHGQGAKGAQAKYVYYDIPKYSDGYSIRGNYTSAGKKVNLAGRLFKGDEPVGEIFHLEGSKEPGALVKLILKEVVPRIK